MSPSTKEWQVISIFTSTLQGGTKVILPPVVRVHRSATGWKYISVLLMALEWIATVLFIFEAFHHGTILSDTVDTLPPVSFIFSQTIRSDSVMCLEMIKNADFAECLFRTAHLFVYQHGSAGVNDN